MNTSKIPLWPMPPSAEEERRRKLAARHFIASVPHHAVASRESGISHKERMRRKRMEQNARKSGQRFA